jgi:hypothetical protein
MAEPFYRVGEPRGPFIVVSDSFEILPSGRTIETVVDSGKNRATTYGWDDDREYYQVCQRGDANVLVPYTIRHRKTELGVPSGACWQYVGSSNYDYWRVLCDWWTDEFTVIEHDVAANPAIFQEFEDCPEPWCTFRYSNHTDENAEAWKYGILGCTRFRSELIQSLPNALRDLGWRYRDWHVLSTGLGITLRNAGFVPHVHGIVDHHRMMDLGGVAQLMAS